MSSECLTKPWHFIAILSPHCRGYNQNLYATTATRSSGLGLCLPLLAPSMNLLRITRLLKQLQNLLFRPWAADVLKRPLRDTTEKLPSMNPACNLQLHGILSEYCSLILQGNEDDMSRSVSCTITVLWISADDSCLSDMFYTQQQTTSKAVCW